MADGGSCVAAPNGEWLLEPQCGDESLYIVELDHARVLEERHSLDVAGHYARPDVTRLVVNRKRQTTAEFIAQSSPLGFACMPEDIARGILFLLSDDTRYMTGHTLVIDAGQTTGAEPPPFFSQEADILLHAGQRGIAATK